MQAGWLSNETLSNYFSLAIKLNVITANDLNDDGHAVWKVVKRNHDTGEACSKPHLHFEALKMAPFREGDTVPQETLPASNDFLQDHIEAVAGAKREYHTIEMFIFSQ